MTSRSQIAGGRSEEQARDAVLNTPWRKRDEPTGDYEGRIGAIGEKQENVPSQVN